MDAAVISFTSGSKEGGGWRWGWVGQGVGWGGAFVSISCLSDLFDSFALYVSIPFISNPHSHFCPPGTSSYGRKSTAIVNLFKTPVLSLLLLISSSASSPAPALVPAPPPLPFLPGFQNISLKMSAILNSCIETKFFAN